MLDEISPFELQEPWDNSGLQVGDPKREVDRIVLSLDLDEKIVDESESNTLFVVHHPLIFGKLDSLDFSRYPSNLIEKLILKRDSVIAMHTNFDKTHLNRYVFENILGFDLFDENGFICRAKGSWNADEILSRIADRLDMKSPRFVNKKKKIETVAFVSGAGASMMDEVDADCFLTGDIKYHDAVKAKSQDMMLVDVGHWESERFFPEVIYPVLKKIRISVIITPFESPFAS